MKISYNSQPQRNLIGNQIFKLRKSRKLSQKEMAAQLQVQGYYFSELTILRIEKGKRLVTDIELKILCDYFHITPNDLRKWLIKAEKLSQKGNYGRTDHTRIEKGKRLYGH